MNNNYNEEYLRNPRQFYSTSLICLATEAKSVIAGALGSGTGKTRNEEIGNEETEIGNGVVSYYPRP